MLYGTLLPGADDRRALRRTRSAPRRAAGHETGVHGWDHVGWHDRLDRMSADEVRRRVRPRPRGVPAHLRRAGAVERRAGLDGERPLARGPGGARRSSTPPTRAAARRSSRGAGERVFRTLEIPTTLPTLDETLAWPELRGDEDQRGVLPRRRSAAPRSTRSTPRSKAARRPRSSSGSWTTGARTASRFVLLSELAREVLAQPRAASPSATLAKARLPGRGGHVATGWPELAAGREPRRRMRARRAVVVAGLLAALAARVLLLRAFSRKLRRRVVRRRGRDPSPGRRPLPRDARYNYSPVWAHVAPRARRASRAGSAARSATSLGGFLLVVDAADGGRALPPRRGRAAGRGGGACSSSLNPVSVFVSSFHLQFDNVAILLLLCALLWARRLPVTRAATVAVALGVAARQAHHGLLSAALPRVAPGARVRSRWRPPCRTRSSRRRFCRTGARWPGVRQNVLGYREPLRGLRRGDAARDLPGVPRWVPGGALRGRGRSRRSRCCGAVPRERACLMLFLVMLLFAPGICEYYFVWPIALGALFGGAGFAVYTVVVAAFFLGSPDGLGLPAAPPARVARRLVEPAAVARVGGAPPLGAPGSGDGAAA